MTGSRILIAALLAAAVLAARHAAAQNAANGETIYKSICISCHGLPPVGGPEKAANNPALIASAISNVPSMSFLQGVYTPSQLSDIAAYIAQVLSGPPPSGPSTPTQNYTDLWFNSGESGWGFNLIQHDGSNNIFGVMYIYEAPNRPLWLVMPGGTWTNPITFTGNLYRVTGIPYNQAFDPARNQVNQVGSATITFDTSGTATVSYVVNGVTTTKSITRQPF